MKAVSHHNEFERRALQSEHLEKTGRAEHGQSIRGVIPEIMIARKRLEWFQKRTNLLCRILFLQRLIEFLDEITKPNRVFLIAWVMAVCGLIEREAGRLRACKRLAEIGRE